MPEQTRTGHRESQGSVIDMSTRQTMSVPEVAKALKKSRATIERAINDGTMPVPLLEGLGKRRRFARVAVEAYLAQLEMVTYDAMALPELAKVLGIGRTQLSEMVKKGQSPVPPLDVFGGAPTFSRIAVEAYLKGEQLSA
jgi:excisionase family DNA binding protein